MKASITPSPIPLETVKVAGKNSAPLPGGFLGQISKRFGARLIPTLSVVAAVSTALVGTSAWNTWSIYQTFRETVAKNFKLQDLSGQIVHLDEVLTMSARMAASTGNTKWQDRYENFVPKLDEALKTTLDLAPKYKTDVAQTDAANIKLVEMEERSFTLVRQNRAPEALKLLLGSDYEQQKQIYSQGINGTLAKIHQEIDGKLETYNRQLLSSALLAGLSFPILLFSWTAIILLVRSYMQERLLAQTSLETLNEELQQRERAIREESEILQADVGELLDAVSAVEAGDLTGEVPVNDRVTGLVADTLNRLVEELAQVLVNVLKAAQEVSKGAAALENAAQAVTDNAGQQAQAVTQVLHLTEQVEQAAQASSQQIQASNVSLLSLNTTVEQGRAALTSLTQSINTLQQGTAQIVQQMKTLGEFVGLTDQFVQEQRQIASLTQVLAVNASLVAARASEQRDPTQFVVVAREFESIASQVSTLAQRTSEGLVTLEQRSTQIHTVVSAVDANVQHLGGLVEGFTQGVGQSNQVFASVRTVASEALQSGEVVAQSSQQILSAAQSTAQVMREIANLATRTLKLSQQASNQSGRMEMLSGQLLQNIQFFSLPEAPVQQPAELPPAPEAVVAASRG